jgi:hypothetical protein
MDDLENPREYIVPLVGERATELFSRAVTGGDLGSPELTEAEQLLVDWGRVLGGAPGEIDHARVESSFNPQLREALVEYAAGLSAK